MKAVFWKECRHQLLSFRSAFFVLLFVILGISLEQLFSLAAIEIGGIDNKTYAGSFYVVIKLAVILLGYLFASILSHGCINRETESKSARLIISKISRTEYIVGKYLANITFWVICFILIYGCLFLKYKVFDVSELITNTVTLIYYNSIIILLSVVMKRGVASNFLGLVVGIVLPFIGLYTMAKNSILRFLFPYSYIFELDWNTLVPIILSVAIIGIAIAIFKRMDL